ncbi:leucyl/phenylalanyl-tRNA--protein transferase [Marinimicrobium alkaliphilum]|uniref:leucyl/phenylalanyl-tRNA--protein transferase n=1 Tax=Marinimicrobium alkaliphilum TaxID=2202654 RepID=UPI000DB9B46B|nr:leucyl/phenylalanyl-tRNA--protein transferase [Marinimicrobium alkaliphilum]
MIPWLNSDSLAFPPVDTALRDPDGLLAAGGDLSPERLLQAYRRGIFPWYEADQPILWWSPDPRTVIRPEHLHIARSLRKALRRRDYDVTFDRDFAAVMRACAAPRNGAHGTWITPEMFVAYNHLHDLGHAHSVEVWREGELIGGLYGIAIGKVFFGESMFSHASNASKIGFAHLARQLQSWGFALIDCQVASEHLFTLGAEEIPRAEFCKILLNWCNEPSVKPWQLTQTFAW